MISIPLFFFAHIMIRVIILQTLSLCMIVKNEEKTLPRCLESVKDIFDEIIIVDTGSTDETINAAKKYTNKIYYFKWQDDFSAARNFAFSKASCDYIMWLDADDVLLDSDREKIIQLKNSLNGSADVIMMPYNTAFDKNGNPQFSFYRERILKRSCGFKWKGRVHEAVEYSGAVVYSDAAVTHKSIKTEYSERNLNIYLKQEKLGEPFSPRDKFYFGRELYYHHHYSLAAAELTEFLDEGLGWVENNIEACKILSLCLKKIKGSNFALSALFRSFLYDAPRAEICCDIGNIFIESENFKTAAFWFERALNSDPPEQSGAFVDHFAYGFIPAIQLAVCYDRLGYTAKAARYNEIAGSFYPESEEYLHNKKYFESVLSNEK